MPGPHQDFPAEAIAQLLGITPRRLQQLAAEGYIPRGDERGTYPLVGAVQGYIRFLRQTTRVRRSIVSLERVWLARCSVAEARAVVEGARCAAADRGVPPEAITPHLDQAIRHLDRVDEAEKRRARIEQAAAQV